MARDSIINQERIAIRKRLEEFSLDELNEQIVKAIKFKNDATSKQKDEKRLAELTIELGRSVQFRKKRQALKGLRQLSPQELDERRYQAERAGLTNEAELIRSVQSGGANIQRGISETRQQRQEFGNNLARLQGEYSDSELYSLLAKAKEGGNTRAATLISQLLQERENNPDLKIEAEKRTRSAQESMDALQNQLGAKTRRELGNTRVATPGEEARIRAEVNRVENQSGFQVLDRNNDKDRSLIEDIERELKRLDDPIELKDFGTPERPDLRTPEGIEDYRRLLSKPNPKAEAVLRYVEELGGDVSNTNDLNKAIREAGIPISASEVKQYVNTEGKINDRIRILVAENVFDPVGEDMKSGNFGLFDGQNKRLFRMPPRNVDGIQQELVGPLGRPVKEESFQFTPGGKEYNAKKAVGWQRSTEAMNNSPMRVVFENVSEVPDLDLEQLRLELPDAEFKRLTANRKAINISPEERTETITFERFPEPKAVFDPEQGTEIVAVGAKITAGDGRIQYFNDASQLDAEISRTDQSAEQRGLVKTVESAPSYGRMEPVWAKKPEDLKKAREVVARRDPNSRLRDYEGGGTLGANRDPVAALEQGINEGRFTKDTPINEAIADGTRQFREANKIRTDLPVGQNTNEKVQTVGDLLKNLQKDGPVQFERRIVNPVWEEAQAYVTKEAKRARKFGVDFTDSDADIIRSEFIQRMEANIPFTERDADGNWNWQDLREERMVPVLKSGQAGFKQDDRSEAKNAIALADRFASGELTEDDLQSFISKERSARLMAEESADPDRDKYDRLNPEPKKIPDIIDNGTEPYRFIGPAQLPSNTDIELDAAGYPRQVNPFRKKVSEDPNDKRYTLEQEPTFDPIELENLRREALVATPDNIDRIRAARLERLADLHEARRHRAQAAVLADVRGDKRLNEDFSKGALGNFIQGGGATPAINAESLVERDGRIMLDAYESVTPEMMRQGLLWQEVWPQVRTGDNRYINPGDLPIRSQFKTVEDNSFIDNQGMQKINIKGYKELSPIEQEQVLRGKAPQTITNSPQAGQALFVGQGPVMEGTPRYVETESKKPVPTMPEPKTLGEAGEWARNLLDQEGQRDGVFNVSLDRVNIEGDEDIEFDQTKVVDPKSATPLRPVEIGRELNDLNMKLRHKGVDIGRPVANLTDLEEALGQLKVINNSVPQGKYKKTGTYVGGWHFEDGVGRNVDKPSIQFLMEDLDYVGDEANFKVAQALFQQGEAVENTQSRPFGDIMKIEGREGQVAQLQREEYKYKDKNGKQKSKEVRAAFRQLKEEDARKNLEDHFIQQAQIFNDERGKGPLSQDAIANARQMANEYINDYELVQGGGLQNSDVVRPFFGAEAESKYQERVQEAERKAFNNLASKEDKIYKWLATDFSGTNAYLAPPVKSNQLQEAAVRAFENGGMSPEYMELLLANQEQVNARTGIDDRMDVRNPFREIPDPANPGVAATGDSAQVRIQGDQSFNMAANQIELERNNREVEELRRLQLEGASAEAPFILGSDNRVVAAAPQGRKLIVPSDSEFNQDPAFREPRNRNQLAGSTLDMQMGLPGSVNKAGYILPGRMPLNAFRDNVASVYEFQDAPSVQESVDVTRRAQQSSPIREEGIVVRATPPFEGEHFSYGPQRAPRSRANTSIAKESKSRTAPAPTSNINLLEAQEAIRNNQSGILDANTPGLDRIMGRERGGAIVPVNAPARRAAPSNQAPQMINDPWGQSTVPETKGASTAYGNVSNEAARRYKSSTSNGSKTYAESSATNASKTYAESTNGKQQPSERKQRENNILSGLKGFFTSPTRRAARRNVGIGAAGLGGGALIGAGLSNSNEEEETQDPRYSLLR